MSKDYELKVLTKVLNQRLDGMMPSLADELDRFEADIDDTVWNLATEVYQQSGHKVELAMVRDVIQSRIKQTKAFLKKRETVDLEQSQVFNQMDSSQNVSEEEQEDLSLEREVAQAVGKFGGDKHKARVFVRVRSTICDVLGSDESEVNLDAHLARHLGADEPDLLEISVALEEEFDIDIPDEGLEHMGIGPQLSVGWSCSGSGNFGYSASEDCIVRNIVEWIAERTSAGV